MKVGIATAATLWAAGAALAADGAVRLSLREAVARALVDGTSARIAAEQTRESEALARIRRADLLPQISTALSGSNQKFNLNTFGFAPLQGPHVVGPFDVVEGRISLAMNVIDVAALERYRAARAGTVVSEEERRANENQVAAAVATLYVAAERAMAKVAQSTRNVELFTRLRDLARDQQRAGVGTPLDTMRADVQRARETQALLVARNDLDDARLALLHAIGADLGSEIELTDPLREVEPRQTSVEAALRTASSERPELQAADHRLRAASLRERAARHARLPTLSVQAYGAENGNSPSGLDAVYSAGGAVALPVFTGGRIEAEVEQARAERRQLVLRRLELERQIGEEVRRAMLAFSSARSRVQVASENARLAEAELRVTRDRYENGVSTSIEVDNAETSLSAAENARIDSLADEVQSDLDLQRATGTIRDLLPPQGGRR